MYNQYLTTAQQRREPEPPAAVHEQAAPVSGLLGALGQRLSGFRLDAETLVVLAVVWFVISEKDCDLDTELLITIGILLLLGV